MRDQVSAFPIQLAKVQRPALRDETLERPRLLDWLRSKINGRVILVLADAGYGKTTLLADFSRRTRARTLWYRFDEDDRDWATIVQHLIAAGREHVPEFAPATADLLTSIGPGGATMDAVLDSFLRELPSIADGGAVLILDDFHLVDQAPDARHIARTLVARAPERLAIVFASRRAPPVPLARLRAVGDVAELDTDDLRFDAHETEQLFSETYGRRLEPDVLADLTDRTEGWIASLQLVQAALRDRSPIEIRRFVRSLTGADHDLYDYLAEEVVGDLDEATQGFLMATSILQVVTPELAEVVAGLHAAETTRLIGVAERLTLLSRVSGGPRTHLRYHPLVRGFLEARLRSIEGDATVADLHRRTAAATVDTDWRVAAYHYREAGDTDAMLEVVRDAIPTIMGNGQYSLAEAFIDPIPPDRRPQGLDLILSRVDLQHGNYEAAIAASEAVLATDPLDPVERDHALLNLLAVYFNFGDAERALKYAEDLEAGASDPNLRAIASASQLVLQTADRGDIDAMTRQVVALARSQRGDRPHHFAVSMLNLAGASLVQDRVDDALREVNESIEAFDVTSAQVERTAAETLRAAILLRLGQVSRAEDELHSVLAGHLDAETESLADAAEAMDSFGSTDGATLMMDLARARGPLTRAGQRALARTECVMAIRRRDFELAEASLASYPDGLATMVGERASRLVIGSYLASAKGDPAARELAARARLHASSQGAHSWRRVAELLEALSDGDRLSDAVAVVGHAAPWNLTYLADLLAPHLGEFGPKAIDGVHRAARLHPERWRTSLRACIGDSSPPIALAAGRLLEQIGDRSDVAMLRRVAKTARRGTPDAGLGRDLAHRIADPIYVEDQGRVHLRIGHRAVEGSDIRRKVLALICFLMTRPDISSTRDQVLDALWPDLDPSLAQNSLNQTLYFMRRVFEENYADDLSPGYVRHDSDLIWFDKGLIQSRSVECRALIRDMPSQPSPDDVERLVEAYRGRFALDFEYEEWAAGYRDSLHAAYLEIVERSVAEDFSNGHFDRGIHVARRVLEVEPHADHVEVCLLRMYRATGAHAAAAEQYAHYAGVLRDDLGIEPPPLDAL